MLAAYAAPAFSQSLIYGPTGAVMQGIYAKQFGLALGSVATVLLVSSIFDAVINPLVGYASDRSRSRHGTRKAWLLCGAVLAVFACWYLYAPRPPVTTAYFMFWLLLAYVGWTVTEVPYGAWMAEISHDYNERTRLATWKAVCTYLGTLAFFSIPYLPFLKTTEFTAESLRWTAILAAITLPAFAVIAITLVPSGTAVARRAGPTARNVWRGVFANRPLILFMVLFLFYHLAAALSYGVTYFFFDAYLHQGAVLAGLFIVALPAGLLAVPLWGYLCRRLGKQRAWAASCALGVLLLLSWALVPSGRAGPVWSGAVMALTVATWAVFPVAAPAVLTDIVDYGRLRFGIDYAGTYFAIYNLMYKAIPGLGAAVALALLGQFGFDPHRAQQTAAANWGLLLTFSLLPAAVLSITVPLLWYFPIDARRQRIIARRLDVRRAPASEGASGLT